MALLLACTCMPAGLLPCLALPNVICSSPQPQASLSVEVKAAYFICFQRCMAVTIVLHSVLFSCLALLREPNQASAA